MLKAAGKADPDFNTNPPPAFPALRHRQLEPQLYIDEGRKITTLCSTASATVIRGTSSIYTMRAGLHDLCT